MPQSPLTSPDVWNTLHQDYDATIVPLFSPVALRGIELVAPKPSDEVLDVACGPGTLTLNIAPRVRRVAAIDFAASMVELLRGKCYDLELTNVEAQVADGTQLPFADRQFDAVFSCFGLFLFADRAKGLAEMFRVARPQAKIMISSWTPAEGPIEEMYRIVRETLPDLPFQQGSAPLGTKDEITYELTQAGLTTLQIESFAVGFAYDSAYDYWHVNSRASAPLVATRRRVPHKDWPAVEARILDTLMQAFPGRVEFDRFAWIAIGQRPAE